MFGRLSVPVAVALGPLLAAPGAAGAQAPTRYTLAGGCWTLSDAGSGKVVAARLRLQATTLGSYLLYRPDRTYLTAQPDGTVAGNPKVNSALRLLCKLPSRP